MVMCAVSWDSGFQLRLFDGGMRSHGMMTMVYVSRVSGYFFLGGSLDL